MRLIAGGRHRIVVTHMDNLIHAVGGPGDETGIAFLIETMRIAAPLIVGTGVATAEQIDLDTFEQRLRDENQRTQAVGAYPMLLSAWATTGPQ